MRRGRNRDRVHTVHLPTLPGLLDKPTGKLESGQGREPRFPEPPHAGGGGWEAQVEKGGGNSLSSGSFFPGFPQPGFVLSFTVQREAPVLIPNVPPT